MQMPTNVVNTTPDFLYGFDKGHPVLFPGDMAQTGPNAGSAVRLNADGTALVSGDGTVIATTTDASYRLAFLGDSRIGLHASGTQIGGAGSGVGVGASRIAGWVAANLQDADSIGTWGVSGDTLISSSSSTGWNGVSRSNSKTIANLLAAQPDAVYIQYGINDLPAATSANLIAAAKSLVSKLVAAGVKVCLSNIMTFDPTAATPNISPANAAATLVKINEFRDAMSAYVSGMPGRAVFVDPNPLITLASTGYGDPQYFDTSDTLGVHPSRIGSQLIGQQAALALRTMLPPKSAKAYTLGPLYQPNLIDWGADASTNVFASNSAVGTTSNTGVSWNVDAAGVPYAECTFTVTALSGGNLAGAILKIDATDVSGATPKFPIFIGDVIQGSARVVIDDGAGNRAAGLQAAYARVRMYSTAPTSQFFNDCMSAVTTVAASTPMLWDFRMVPPASASPIASVNIDTPQSSSARGFYYLVQFEANALGTYRVRIYAPSLRVVSRPQPVSVTAGASPYVFQNNPQPFVFNDWINGGRDMMVTVAPGSGGTISQIAIGRGPTVSSSFLNAVNTGLTSGAFVLKPGDGLLVTWATTAAVLTYTYL